MSLLYKSIDSITFQDVEDFCLQELPEGPRLDYKAQIPRELEKLVASFANTMGGTIVFGVDGDPTTNTPKWPPTGMPRIPGIEERITALCRDNIYPPVRPQISSVLENPHQPGTVVVVVRVDESPDAPHAVKGRYIYERTGSQNKPYDLAHLDRIQHLLRRRDRIEEQRRDLVARELKRAAHQLADIALELGEEAGMKSSEVVPNGPRGLPLRWASVIPVFPWRELCPTTVCYEALRLFGFSSASSWQKVPGGAMGIDQTAIGGTNRLHNIGVCSISLKGHVFAMQCTRETHDYSAATRLSGKEPENYFVDLAATRHFATRTFQAAAKFYLEPRVELPGYLLLAIGLLGVLDVKMALARGVSPAGKRFVDEDFSCERTLLINELEDDVEKAAEPLFEELKFGFDL